MIKLIASDLDGTIVPEGTKEINPEFYDVVRKLHDKGIIFVAASGRDIGTMRTVITPVSDIIYSISNNGGRITTYENEDIVIYFLDFSLVKNVILDTRKDENVIFVSVSTDSGTYSDSRDEEVLRWLYEGYGLDVINVEDMIEKPLDVIKISVLTKGNAADVVDAYEKKYGDLCHVTVAGERWIDFTHSMADKGIAFKNFIELFGIKPEETWAFGDNINDITMLKAAGTGFAAPGARDEVKAEADVCLDGDIYDAVVKQMKTLL